ncbi:hypothetical protein [Acinetobacter ursingii]|uniref:hypothetical protein n=1 Tax=Acinetobacter ursingii TaxID=108980 RepID=UPI0030082369
MKTTTIHIVLEALIKVLEEEAINLESITFNLESEGKKHQVPFTKLIDLARQDLEQIQTESTRLDFMLENRIRVEKWNTNPSSEFYFVMNEDDESIAKAKDGRDAIDEAMAALAEETE